MLVAEAEWVFQSCSRRIASCWWACWAGVLEQLLFAMLDRVSVAFWLSSISSRAWPSLCLAKEFLLV